jgi:hypothetical protein
MMDVDYENYGSGSTPVGYSPEEIDSMFTETPAITNALLGSGTDWGKLLTTLGPTALAGILQGTGMLGGSQQKSGYQGGIPDLTATRQQLPIDYNADRRPGSMGRRYFTDMVYAPKVTAPTTPPPAAPVVTAPAGGAPVAAVTPYIGPYIGPDRPLIPLDNNTYAAAAQGGMIGYAQGGIANLGYYLGGATDGMADKIPAKIEGKQQAKLSHGEFVIPADIVSALGSGNSSAGAKVLYSMMDRVRQHAHGTKKQIKPANPKKTLPA